MPEVTKSCSEAGAKRGMNVELLEPICRCVGEGLVDQNSAAKLLWLTLTDPDGDEMAGLVEAANEGCERYSGDATQTDTEVETKRTKG